MSTKYQKVAATYDRRYEHLRYAGTERALREHVGSTPCDVLEVGCGTAHWLALLARSGHRVMGVEPSEAMLEVARTKVPAQRLHHGSAEALPFANATFDRLYTNNALHHFRDPERALREARRVLRAGGAVLLIGLDPAAGLDHWCIYDFFAGTRERDLKRFPPTATIRRWLLESGFTECETFVAEHIELCIEARAALASGGLAKVSTSQLIDLSDADYATGIAAIECAAAAAEAEGQALQLTSDLHLFGTLGRVAT
jgi:SAM-dependent methyltransferase